MDQFKLEKAAGVMTERHKLSYMIQVMENQIEVIGHVGVHSVLEPYTEEVNPELSEDDALEMMQRHTAILKENVKQLKEQRAKL